MWRSKVICEMNVKHTLLGGGIERFSRDYTLDKKGTSITYCHKKDEFAPKPVLISWEKKEHARRYILSIATENDFSNAKQFVAEQNSIELTNLCMDTGYFCRIMTEYIDDTTEEEVFPFQTEALPRTINMDGVSNTRDMGGYFTKDGTCRMKQDSPSIKRRNKG